VKKGPFTSGQLTQFAKAGQLLPTDQVWKQGMPEWVPASRLPQLFQVEPPTQTVEQSAGSISDQEPAVVVQPVSGQRRRKTKNVFLMSVPLVAVAGVCLFLGYYLVKARPSGGLKVSLPSSGRPVKEPKPESEFFKEVVLTPRSSGEQESLRRKARQITLGMSEDEVVEIMGCKWDGYVDVSHKTRMLCWDTGGLTTLVGTTPHQFEGEMLDSRQVIFVSEGSSGYVLGALPPPEHPY
jgi:hypothetical protein